jgi:hypothetical protein
LYSSTQDIVRRGKRFPNYYGIKGTTRGKHIRRGKHFTDIYTPRIKGTTRGKHVPERNICQYESTKHLGEPPVQDEDMNLHKQPVEGEERSLPGMSTFGQNNNNGLLFAPTCTTCFNVNKYLLTSEKVCPPME